MSRRDDYFFGLLVCLGVAFLLAALSSCGSIELYALDAGEALLPPIVIPARLPNPPLVLSVDATHTLVDSGVPAVLVEPSDAARSDGADDASTDSFIGPIIPPECVNGVQSYHCDSGLCACP